jgi:hypothetical protein
MDEGRLSRTKLPFARAAIAHAAFPRSCSSFFAAMRPSSWKRPFDITDLGEFETDLSLRSFQTIEIRTMQTSAGTPVLCW